MTLKSNILITSILVCAGLSITSVYAQDDSTPPADPCPLQPLKFSKIHPTLAEQKAEEKELKKLQSLEQLQCLKSLAEQTDDITNRVAKLEELHMEANPKPVEPLKKEKSTSEDNFISSFELGFMQRPDYEDGNSKGFSQTDQYFDAYIDGRFEFDDLWGTSNILINTTFLTSFYGEGVQTPEDGNTSPFPTSFNDVSDTMDASFSLRFSAIEAENDCLFSCLFANKDKTSSLGVMLRYGLVNRDNQPADFDTVINYYGIGLDYRLYRDDMNAVGNAIPDFNVTWLVTRYEEYGVRETMAGCFAGGNEAGCLEAIEDPTRHIFQLRYRLVKDKPYFIGMRLNAGDGLDDYGVTLGIRKNATDILKFFGVGE